MLNDRLCGCAADAARASSDADKDDIVLMQVWGCTSTVREGGVSSAREAAAGGQIWRAEVVRDAPPPRETDVTEGGMGGGGIIALLVSLSSAMVIDGLCRFIEGGDVRLRSVYVRIGTRFFVVEEGAIFNCT